MSTARPYSCVLDASALLALLHDEPGGREVEPFLGEAAVSSVNWSEVVQKSLPARWSWKACEKISKLWA